MNGGGADIGRTIEAVYRAESRRVLATLIRLLRDFERAEEALHDAFAAAARQWPKEGVPANPRAWLVSAGRFKAVDALRRRARFDAAAAEIAMRIEADAGTDEIEEIEDDRLRLIFTCCHPALAPDARIALTLREVCGLTTEEIGARLPRTGADARPADRARQGEDPRSRIPYEVPPREDLPERLEAVLHVIYLVFNEGYSPSRGTSLTRHDLSAEAIRLARLVVALMPEPEAVGLLALLLLQESRRAARTGTDGDMILLADQDRGLWDREAIAEGMALARRAFAAPEIGPYALQAAIAAEHAGSETARRRTGRESPLSTTCSSKRSPRRWSGSTARWRSPCATDRRPALRWSTRCSPRATSTATRLPIRRGPISAGNSAARPRRGSRTAAPWN